MQDWLCVKCAGAATLRQLRDGRVRPFCEKHGAGMIRVARTPTGAVYPILDKTFYVSDSPQEGKNATFTFDGSTIQACSVCHVTYPYPVSSHHTPEECAKNRKPGSALEIRGGNGTIKNEPVGSIVIAPDAPKYTFSSGGTTEPGQTIYVSGPPVKGENAKITDIRRFYHNGDAI